MDLSTVRARAPYAAQMRTLRAERRWTQRECAEALGVSQPSYAAMEGNQARFRRRDLVTLAEMYELSLAEAFPEPDR